MHTSDKTLYFLVINPEGNRATAQQICTEEYSGTLANITTYEQLKAINELMAAQLPAIVYQDLNDHIWVNGHTDAPKYPNNGVNFTVHDVQVLENGKLAHHIVGDKKK